MLIKSPEDVVRVLAGMRTLQDSILAVDKDGDVCVTCRTSRASLDELAEKYVWMERISSPRTPLQSLLLEIGNPGDWDIEDIRTSVKGQHAVFFSAAETALGCRLPNGLHPVAWAIYQRLLQREEAVY